MTKRMMGRVDLHLHTTASDGVLSPSRIVRYAKEKGLKAIAITDHDTIDGNTEALDEGARLSLEVIPGVEISAQFELGSMHILGFFIDIGNRGLNERLSLLQETRAKRNPKMVQKLRELGVEISYDEVFQASGGGQVGRPHFAQVLLKKGYVNTMQEAFDRYLGKGAPAYVHKFRFDPREAMKLIREARGIPVLAHPFTLHLESAHQLNGLLAEMVQLGLMGIEISYPEHTKDQISLYKGLAEKHGLLVTGGSDYHGIETGKVDIGIGSRDMRLSYSMVEAMKEALDLNS
ncbi:MAG: PHP domain-containing protein [Proteobacteria bacterium]|nr:PHP domain-containing protein [Pseudomonadota bacterium]